MSAWPGATVSVQNTFSVSPTPIVAVSGRRHPHSYQIGRTRLPLIGATTVGTGGDWSPTFRLGTNNVLVPQLLGRSFQKASNFTARDCPLISIVTRMQDLASEFSKIFRGLYPGPSQRASAPVLGPKPWSPFSAVVAPLFHCWLSCVSGG